MKIVVSGSTGLIGSALTKALLRRDHDVVPMVRRRLTPGERAVAWDPERATLDRTGLEGVDAVVHLAGENVFGRWSQAKKQRIYDSRVKGTRLLRANSTIRIVEADVRGPMTSTPMPSTCCNASRRAMKVDSRRSLRGPSCSARRSS